MQQEILRSDAFTTTQKSPKWSGEGSCSRKSGHNVLSPLKLSHAIVYSRYRGSALTTKSSLDIFVCVLYVYGTTFSSWHFFCFCHFCIDHVLETSSRPLASGYSCGGSPSVLSQRLIGHPLELLLGGLQRNSAESSHSDICVLTYSLRRYSWIRCMSENSSCHVWCVSSLLITDIGHFLLLEP